MQRHNRRPQINVLPGQQFGLTVTLKKTQPAAEAEEACECDISGIFWESSESSGVFDQTAIAHSLGAGGEGDLG